MRHRPHAADGRTLLNTFDAFARPAATQVRKVTDLVDAFNKRDLQKLVPKR